MSTTSILPANLTEGMPPIVIAEPDTFEEVILRMKGWTLTITENAGREFDMSVTDTGRNAEGFLTMTGHIVNNPALAMVVGEITICTEDVASVYVN